VNTIFTLPAHWWAVPSLLKTLLTFVKFTALEITKFLLFLSYCDDKTSMQKTSPLWNSSYIHQVAEKACKRSRTLIDVTNHAAALGRTANGYNTW